MFKKRKRFTIKKAREAILKTANQFQAVGINCSHRSIVVGGTQPKLVAKVRDEQRKKGNTGGN